VAIGANGNGGAGSAAGHVRVYEYKTITETEYNNGNTANTTGATGVPIIVDGGVSWGASTKFWVQQGDDIDGEAAGDNSGWSVSLSSNGTIVAIGAKYNLGDGGSNTGHVRVFEYSGSSWSKIGSDIDGEAGSYSGESVSLSSDGSIVAIGSTHASTATGHTRVYEYKTITEDEYDKGNTANATGAPGVPIIVDGGVSWGASTKFWVQQGDDIDGEETYDYSGNSVSLNGSGSTVAIGAPYNDGGGDRAGSVIIYKTTSNLSPQVGDWAVAKHKEQSGADLSTYTYRVTQVVDADTLKLEFVSATNGYTDDSPCDLCDGTESAGGCGGIAPHVIKRDLGGMFMVLLD
jgi:hypothetical protein